MAAKDEDEAEATAPEGAEGTDAAAEYEEAQGGKKKLILLVVLPLLVLAGAGAGLYFSGFLDKWIKPAPVEGEHAAVPAEGEHAPAEGEHGVPTAGAQFLKIPDMTVNLNSEDGTPRYLRLSVQLELKNGIDLQAVEKVMPRVVDQFQTYLRELRVRDLRGSAGIYRLQAELLARVNQAAYPVEVQDVLFQEILIQ